MKFNEATQAGSGGTGARAVSWPLAALVAAPWLWPFTSGPTANALPLLFSWGALAVAFLATIHWPRSEQAVRHSIALGWLLAALLSSLIALSQWFGVLPSTPLFSSAPVAEAYGNLRQRNQFASLTSIGLLALLTIAPRPSRLALLAAVVLAFANAASASRTGLLQWMLIALLAAWGRLGRQSLRLSVIALIAYGAATALLPMALMAWHGVEAANVLNRSVAELGCSSRIVLWSNVAELIMRRPWTGWGAGELDYAHYATLFSGPRFCAILDNAHNLPLHLAVEFGLPVAVLACAAAGWLVWRGRPWAAQDPGVQLAWGVLAVIGLHSLVEYPLWYGPFQLAVLQCLWLIRPKGWPLLPTRGAQFLLSLAMLAGIGWMLHEYALVSQAYKPAEERRPDMRLDPVASAGHIRLFRDQLEFAELSLTPLSRSTAPRVHELAARMLHYSPEPQVIEKMIESAWVLGRNEEAQWHSVRYRAAFPDRYRRWLGLAADPGQPATTPSTPPISPRASPAAARP